MMPYIFRKLLTVITITSNIYYCIHFSVKLTTTFSTIASLLRNPIINLLRI